MRFLLDSNMSRAAYTFLVDAGEEVDWVRHWSADPGDESILMHARERDMVVVTFDKDFGELAIRNGAAHAGIIRLQDIGAKSQGRLALLAAREYADVLAEGGVVTMSPGRIRVRR